MNRFRSALLCSLFASAPVAAQAQANPSILADQITVAGVTVSTHIPVPVWYVLDPSTSVCEHAPMSPRAYSAAQRAGGSMTEMKVLRFTSTGDIGIVEIHRHDEHGSERVLPFYASAGVCRAALALRVRDGELLPPDMK